MKVTYEKNDEFFRLYVTSFGMKSRAGMRLIKGGKCPVDSFRSKSRSDITRKRDALQAYLDGRVESKKKMTKREERALNAQNRINELKALCSGGGLFEA